MAGKNPSGRPRIHASNAARQKAYRARKKRSVHFRSETADWSTPQDLFDTLNDEFKFTLDVCATAKNAKCPLYYTIQQDGLAQHWTGTCWCHPPYGRGIERWIRKAYESSQMGATVVLLIPAHTDTRYWHDWVVRGETRFVKGRLRFSDSKSAAPHASVIVVFRPTGRDEMLE